MARRAHSYLLLAVLVMFVSPWVRAQRTAVTPQSSEFDDAYRIAEDLAHGIPGAKVVTAASTFSMYPLVDWDTLVVIAPVKLSQVRVGDIVSFRDTDSDGAHTIMHRVKRIFVKDGRLVTRGDHLEHDDPHPVTSERLVGRATYLVYFSRAGEARPAKYALPTPKRYARFVDLGCGDIAAVGGR